MGRHEEPIRIVENEKVGLSGYFFFLEKNMEQINISPFRGSAQITREQFLFYEMRTTAELLCEGLDEHEVVERIVRQCMAETIRCR